tara:strand:- start:1166 stop:2095 length:930 start_codon:yes stop_codon:yes gene_type:complete
MSEYKFAIEAKHLNKTYQKNKSKPIRALIDFEIKIPRGSIYGLLGPNGAGKSTFINILGGLVKKDSGNIQVCGINTDDNLKETKKKIGIVPQELNMDPFFTPYELLELQAGLYGVKKKDRQTDEILKRVRLTDQKNAYARTLSGGMRRRLLVAKSLVHNPEVVILDEPTAGVDIELRENLWEYIKELNKNGTTICLTTHYLEEAEKLCDYITIINDGKVLKTDTKENLLNLIGKKNVSFILSKDIKEIPISLKKFDPVIENNKLLLNYDKNQTKLREIINILNDNKILFDEINTYESDLKDVFINLIKK